jgi:hypothetical protein
MDFFRVAASESLILNLTPATRVCAGNIDRRTHRRNDITGSRRRCRSTLPGAAILRTTLQLLDWVGRQPQSGQSAAIPAELPPVLERLGIAADELVETVRDFPQRFRRLAGRVERFVERAAAVGRHWFQGVRHAARIFR